MTAWETIFGVRRGRFAPPAGALLALAFALAACAAGPAAPTVPPTSTQGVPGESAARAGNLAHVIYVIPVDGAAATVGIVLADAIAAEIRDQNRPAILANEPNQAGASVVARVVAAERRGEVVWLTLSWGIRAPYGTEVATYRQQVVVDAKMWEQGAPEAINLLVGDAAPKIIDMIQAHVGPAPNIEMVHPAAPNVGAIQSVSAPAAEPALPSVPVKPGAVPVPPVQAAAVPPPSGPAGAPASAPAASEGPAGPPRALTPGAAAVAKANAAPEKDEGMLSGVFPSTESSVRRPDDARPGPSETFSSIRWGRPAFLIKPVKGAPGNGNEALTAALKTALRDRDITISEDPRQAGFAIQGVVEMGPPSNGRQFTKIVWRVNTMAGQEVGKAVQENTVVAGSLDGDWGQVAEVVSHAAVRGIRELFGEADSQIRSTERLPEFPSVDLPTMPGRAPPPPGN